VCDKISIPSFNTSQCSAPLNNTDCCRLTKDWPRFKEELDMLKFLCTDFWSSIYKRQVDNLRTNHQGVYVLMDNDFRFLNKLSASSQYVEYAPQVSIRFYFRNYNSSFFPRILLWNWLCINYDLLQYVTFTCGLIRGALANLGTTCIVTAEVHAMPACKFHIEVQ
jgi:hypothetical protein